MLYGILMHNSSQKKIASLYLSTGCNDLRGNTLVCGLRLSDMMDMSDILAACAKSCPQTTMGT